MTSLGSGFDDDSVQLWVSNDRREKSGQEIGILCWPLEKSTQQKMRNLVAEKFNG